MIESVTLYYANLEITKVKGYDKDTGSYDTYETKIEYEYEVSKLDVEEVLINVLGIAEEEVENNFDKVFEENEIAICKEFEQEARITAESEG